MISKKIVRDYYRSFSPWLPSGSGSYHYRVRCLDGTWRKIKVRVNSPEKLKKQLFSSDEKIKCLRERLREEGVDERSVRRIVKDLRGKDAGDVYYSCARWLNPEKISSKHDRKGFLVSDMVFLGEDYVFDIDARNISLEEWELARKNALKLYNWIKKNKPKIKEILLILSGAKGFQIRGLLDEKPPKDPRKRLVESIKKRKLFKDEIPTNIRFDKELFLNPLFVGRLPGTVNIKTGYIATIISLEQLKKPIKELLKDVPYITCKRPGIPQKGEMTNSPRLKTKKSGGVAGLAPQTIIIPCYTNQVIGCNDRYMLALKYDPEQKYRRDIRFLQKHYRLGKTYVLKSYERNRFFKKQKKIFVITHQTFTNKRLIKMYNKTSALNKSEQKVLKYVKIPIRPYKLLEEINSPNPVKAGSLGHKNLIVSILNKRPRAWSWEGKDRINILMNIKGR